MAENDTNDRKMAKITVFTINLAFRPLNLTLQDNHPVRIRLPNASVRRKEPRQQQFVLVDS